MKKAYLRRAPGNSGEGTLGMVEGVIVPFGSPALRDSYGNWWDQKSDFVLSAYSNRPLFNYHTGDGHYNRAGYILDDSLELRDEGLFAKGVILDNDEGRTFLRDLERGKSYYSTGVMPNQMAIRDDGYVERWPIVEVSQVPNPAAFRGETRVSRSFLRDNAQETILYGGIYMPPKERKEAVTPEGAGDRVPQQEPQVAVSVLNDLRASIDTLAERVAPPQPDFVRQAERQIPQGVNVNGAPQIQVMSEYDDVSLGAMLFWHAGVSALSPMKVPTLFGDRFLRAVADKAERALKREEKEAERYLEVGAQPPVWLRSVDKISFDAWHKRVPYLRANEAMATSLTGYGEELVPTLFASTAWHDITLASRVLSNLPVFDMPSNPYKQTVIGNPTVRAVPEFTNQAQASAAASNIPDSKPGTSQVTWDAGAIGALTLFSQTMLEDAGISMVNELYRSYVEAMAAAADLIIIIGDESATVANIAHFGTDPTSTAYDAALQLDGLWHQAIANSDTVAEATIAATTINKVRKMMGTRGVLGINPRDLVAFVDASTWYKYLDLSSIQTIDKVGPKATLLTGEFASLSGVPVIPVANLELANASGQIEDSHDGTKGTTTIVNRKAVKVGRMRNFMVQNAMVPGTTGHLIWATMRLDVQLLQAGAAAYAYNHTVT